ncbi:MAG: DNA translocase FtsK [Spirosomaceae bacterium]|nr:DNA translocase FtsK [Spirosomataceae bacterium]
MVAGVLFIALSVLMFISFVSFLFTGTADHDLVRNEFTTTVTETTRRAENTLGLFGAYISHWFIYKWFGIAAFGWLPIMFLGGYRMIFQKDLFEINLNRYAVATLFYVFFISIFFGYFVVNFDLNEHGITSGGIGFSVNNYLSRIIGWGGIFILAAALVGWLIMFHGFTEIDDAVSAYISQFFKKRRSFQEKLDDLDNSYEDEEEETFIPRKERQSEPIKTTEKETNLIQEKPFQGGVDFSVEARKEQPPVIEEEPEEESLQLQIDETPNSFVPDDDDEEDVNEKLLKDFGLYDPTLELSGYKFPPISILSNHTSPTKVTDAELAIELEQNKNNIVETMRNFSIGISSIKATVGPTVTLYEIIPEAGVRISKIKNLEDDIALSLAALGIRIIAPMPGKGTIGIEVPNTNREIVSTKSCIAGEKFQNSKYELPIILGKTISNEIYVGDLAKMPHLLMAGATGQGKSVGLNVILTSLLYKKHPAEIKFVLVDPKKVELTLFNKIERHFLAMLPGSEEAIITDTKKVIHTLNSLCIEMDSRYDLLKDAQVRNIREYNTKFAKRRLSPEKGHKFLPYIILVIDELADLMMTAGKEVEQPIARLAQLARAIGIHLIVATQRPSVNVITGLIKANFPARLSFKVTAKVDSRTILDTGGAEQLVGNGDMLLSMGSSTVRLQCPFVDTPEVEEICDFIGSQRGYESAYLLPEFVGDDEGSSLDFNPNETDPLFEDAARLLVASGQGSTSLIQRKMKIGYNRAGRIVDQLEAAGILGPFEGSKAREVLVKTLEELEGVLRGLKN